MKLIPLKGKYGDGKFAKVSDEDFDFLIQLKWHVSDRGYAKTYYQGKHRQMHHFIKGKDCDHINRDKLDNQRENLRPATRRQNNANTTRKNESGYKGVYKDPTCNRWKALISVNGKMVHLGNFKEKRHAAMCYDLWAKDLHGEEVPDHSCKWPIVALG